MNNTKSQETIHFKAKLYCGSTFGESTEATLNLEGSGIHHSDLAAYVTKAVNCHDDLLEACKAVLTRQDWPVGTMKIKSQIQAAIEKASAQ